MMRPMQKKALKLWAGRATGWTVIQLYDKNTDIVYNWVAKGILSRFRMTCIHTHTDRFKANKKLIRLNENAYIINSIHKQRIWLSEFSVAYFGLVNLWKSFIRKRSHFMIWLFQINEPNVRDWEWERDKSQRKRRRRRV